MKLYGKGGRTYRSLWMLEEAEVEYERELVDWSQGEALAAEYIALNPNGKVPLLVDGETIVFESFVINYYLAKHYAPSLWIDDDLLTSQWLAWGLSELEGPHDAANRAKTEIDQDRLDRSLNLLRRELRKQPYIAGSEFTVVDLNTACLAFRPQYRPVIEADGELRDWLGRCSARPALSRAMQSNDG